MFASANPSVNLYVVGVVVLHEDGAKKKKYLLFMVTRCHLTEKSVFGRKCLQCIHLRGNQVSLLTNPKDDFDLCAYYYWQHQCCCFYQHIALNGCKSSLNFSLTLFLAFTSLFWSLTSTFTLQMYLIIWHLRFDFVLLCFQMYNIASKESMYLLKTCLKAAKKYHYSSVTKTSKSMQPA